LYMGSKQGLLITISKPAHPARSKISMIFGL
jgi:hypothetical protein